MKKTCLSLGFRVGLLFLFPTILLPLKSYFYKIHFTRNVIFIWWKQLKGDLLPVCTLCLDSNLYTYKVSYIHLLEFNIRKRMLDFFQVFFSSPPQQIDVNLKLFHGFSCHFIRQCSLNDTDWELGKIGGGQAIWPPRQSKAGSELPKGLLWGNISKNVCIKPMNTNILKNIFLYANIVILNNGRADALKQCFPLPLYQLNHRFFCRNYFWQVYIFYLSSICPKSFT